MRILGELYFNGIELAKVFPNVHNIRFEYCENFEDEIKYFTKLVSVTIRGTVFKKPDFFRKYKNILFVCDDTNMRKINEPNLRFRCFIDYNKLKSILPFADKYVELIIIFMKIPYNTISILQSYAYIFICFFAK
jgi:hypothetical protein